MLPGTNVTTNSSVSNPRIFYGWFVVAGTFAVTFVGFGCAYSFSAFLLPLQHDFAASRGSISLVFSIAGFFYFALGVITGPLADRFGSRLLAVIGISHTAGSVLALAAILLTSTIAMADTTWLCSAAMEKESDKRTAFKFEVKGGELFGQTYIQHIERILGPKLKKFGWPTEKNVNAASYKIVEDKMSVCLRFMPIHLVPVVRTR